MKVSDFPIKLNEKTVLRLMECGQNSPQHDEFVEEIHDIEPEVNTWIHPEAVFDFYTIEEAYASEALPQGTPVICVLATVGGEISMHATEYFSEGDCVKGMLVDAMADDFLFQMESVLQGYIKAECAKRKVGIAGRLEAPNDIPIQMQKMVWEKTHALEELNVNINESLMLNPVKSICYIFKLIDDETIFKTQHDCRKCSSFNCKMRQVPPVNL